MCLQFHLYQTFFLLMLPLFWINYCLQMSVNLIFRILHESTTNLSSHLLPSGLSFRKIMDLTTEIAQWTVTDFIMPAAERLIFSYLEITHLSLPGLWWLLRSLLVGFVCQMSGTPALLSKHWGTQQRKSHQVAGFLQTPWRPLSAQWEHWSLCSHYRSVMRHSQVDKLRLY